MRREKQGLYESGWNERHRKVKPWEASSIRCRQQLRVRHWRFGGMFMSVSHRFWRDVSERVPPRSTVDPTGAPCRRPPSRPLPPRHTVSPPVITRARALLATEGPGRAWRKGKLSATQGADTCENNTGQPRDEVCRWRSWTCFHVWTS